MKNLTDSISFVLSSIKSCDKLFIHSIFYKPVKKCDEIINYYFNEKLNAAFPASFSKGTKIKHCSAWQSYFCLNYYSRKDKFDCHFENCTGRPSYVYNFKRESFTTIEENLKHKGIFLWLSISILKLKYQLMNVLILKIGKCLPFHTS